MRTIENVCLQGPYRNVTVTRTITYEDHLEPVQKDHREHVHLRGP